MATMDVLLPTVSAIGPCAAALGLGWFLRQSVCNETDGESAAKFALWITLPSLILQSFNRVPLAELGFPIVALYTLSLAISAAIAWYRSQTLHPRERGLLAGVSIGSSTALASIPLATVLFPLAGLRTALLCAGINILAAHVFSYMLFSTAGAAFPESFEHLDGGRYQGEWKGMLKDGHGVYFYPGNARYEGQWRDGLKEGRGVYFFPKGGLYEGEWRAGTMAGVGIRTFASGKVQSGLWENGKLVQSIDEVQCALAVEGANEAATVARNVIVGGASWGVAMQRMAVQPATWACIAVVVMAVLGKPLTPSIDAVTGTLAAAHGPLALLGVGLSLNFAPLPERQVKEIAMSLSGRLLPPLLISLVACIAAHLLALPVTSTLLCLLGPFIICTTAPVSSTALLYAHIFRLNEALAAGLVQASTPLSLLLMVFLGATAAVSARLQSLLPFATAVVAVAMSIALTTVLIGVRHSSGSSSGGDRPPKNKVKMVYTGSGPPYGAGAAASSPSELLSSAETATEVVQDDASSEQQQKSNAEASPSPSEEKIHKPEKLRRAHFKDLGGASGGGGEGSGPSPSPPPPAAAALRNRKRSLLRTHYDYGIKNRVAGIRSSKSVPRTVISFLR